ncbi:MAG: hypothetical protein COS34_01050 [Lysobacterales bacterium CG02_land_8_20_14_3_00_62_12]|nr:MAG: hypothetical protein COS34_01050 [Xanthomonadales bacterium CG02_land_8_20_14_3_00_62_12]
MPDHGDVVQLYLVNCRSGRTESHHAALSVEGAWQCARTGQLFDVHPRKDVLMGWTPLTEAQLIKYAERRRLRR